MSDNRMRFSSPGNKYIAELIQTRWCVVVQLIYILGGFLSLNSILLGVTIGWRGDWLGLSIFKGKTTGYLPFTCNHSLSISSLVRLVMCDALAVFRKTAYIILTRGKISVYIFNTLEWLTLPSVVYAYKQTESV